MTRPRALIVAAAIALMPVVMADAAQIDLPIRTWVKRPLPVGGQGPCPARGCKHMRLAHNSQNGRIYFLGGDYGGSGYSDSGRNEVWSYSIADSSWRLEYPYCGPPGEYQASHPDEVGWAHDTRRNIFWMVPGFMYDPGACAEPTATQVAHETMTFDPVSKTWDFPRRTRSAGSKYAVYDPVEDTIIQVLYTGGPGIGVYHIATDTWEVVISPSLLEATDSQTAVDYVARKLYVIGRVSVGASIVTKLFRYDMDLKIMEIIDDTPPLIRAPYPHLVWDSASQVLILEDYEVDTPASQATAYAYSPTRRVWEPIPLVLPEDGGPVYGNHMVYDPQQNVVLLMGGDVDPARPYFYLYRYAAAAADSVAPSAPADLHVH